MLRQLALLTCLLLAVLGCETLDSETLRGNDELHATFEVTIEDDGVTEVEAVLRVGGPLSNVTLDLSDGDELVASADRTSDVLRRKRVLGMISYIAELPTDRGGTDLQVALFRPNDVDAPGTYVTLPERIVVRQPEAGDAFSWDGESITVAWSPSRQPGTVLLDFNGSCGDFDFHTTKELESDPGRATYAIDDLVPAHIRAAANGCGVDISLTRRIEGVIDRSYGEGGHIVAKRRTGTFVSFVPGSSARQTATASTPVR